ncbi:hypothetical protein ACSQ67_010068 [Phaseolus vulgaris]
MVFDGKESVGCNGSIMLYARKIYESYRTSLKVRVSILDEKCAECFSAVEAHTDLSKFPLTVGESNLGQKAAYKFIIVVLTVYVVAS